MNTPQALEERLVDFAVSHTFSFRHSRATARQPRWIDE